jgi:tRNA(fMet)-specific endonuclease VapC
VNLWIFDTDTISLFQRGHPIVRQRVNATTPEQLATKIITFEEQMY